MPDNSKQKSDPVFAGGQTAAGKVATLWCGFMHDSSMWPIHGQYQCRTCGRRYLVPWAGNRVLAHASAQAAGVRPVRVLPALLPLAMLLAILPASRLRAADAPVVDSVLAASRAFALYTAGLEQASPWSLETVEIDAALPKLDKQGRLLAIRRLLPLGKAEYRVLEMAGDRTVKQQVIGRYLSAEARAAAIPACSVAVTPVNYKFHYKGSVKTGKMVAYVFQITPRIKREGLIKGELWLDGETGTAVRQAGYFVKSPSIFVKRVDVTRETALRDGIPGARVTHLSLETRLVGPAELTIQERPWTAPDPGPALNIAER